MLEYEDLIQDENCQKCYDALVKYLAISPRSEKECKDRLYQKGFHRNEVEFAIVKAKRYRYIDDSEYVRSFILFNQKRYGAKKIAYKLSTEKGVDKTLVDNMIEDLMGEDVQLDVCSDFAKKYIAQKKLTDKKDKSKLCAYLYQKGFSFGIINKVVDTYFDTTFDED